MSRLRQFTPGVFAAVAFASVCLFTLMAQPAVAQSATKVSVSPGATPQLVNVSGASNVAINGFDPVDFFTKSKATNGSPSISSSFQGATYYFSSEANKALFASTPDKYVPQYGGYCAFGVAINMLLPIDISTHQVRNGKLYFNINPAVRAKFDADFHGNEAKANTNWPALKAKNIK